MKAAGFSDVEMKLLGEAKAQSDDLVNLEIKAMQLIEGVVTSAGNEVAASVAPDLEGAQKLLYSHDYHAAKAKVMLPIAQFFDELNRRTPGPCCRDIKCCGCTEQADLYGWRGIAPDSALHRHCFRHHAAPAHQT